MLCRGVCAGHSQQTTQHQQPGAIPVYLLNEINLLTLLDSVKLLTGGGGNGAGDDGGGGGGAAA